MEKSNSVFIATSLDGQIADKDGGIEWLDSIPGINTIDTGYEAFMSRIDAMIMGRKTFQKVLSFGIDWPYAKPVYVLSNSLAKVPEKLSGKAHLVKGSLEDVLKDLHESGHLRLYVDGGSTIRSFLAKDCIDEMIITRIPILVGDGVPLFGNIPVSLKFELVESKVYLGQIVQDHYKRSAKVEKR
ncbi:MAG: dihydrofolate reductase [Flavobacteriales bacterium]|nr:dihydrofolate reductase [Flavobacteriales bacterium]NNK80804.1 dihydrofolate reductase [Flavobacteriales bacterium]